jgi:ribosomal protein S18 acetylase RimI-like enzyme
MNVMFEPFAPNAQSQPLDYHIVTAGREHFAAIAELIEQREGYAIDRAHLRRLLRAENTIALVAIERDRVVGYGKATQFLGDDYSPQGWYLSGLIVDPAYRRGGIARALTAQRLQQLAQHTSTVYYFANVNNHTSIALHEEFGFELIDNDFAFPGVTFNNGHGQLFKLDL